MIPQYKIVTQGDRRAYVREEHGGAKRVLTVWHVDSCLEKIRKADREGKLKGMFEAMELNRAQYSTIPVDPMLCDWFNECMMNMDKAYEAHTAPSKELGEPVEEFTITPALLTEEFGFDTTIEEFGIEVEEFAL